MIIVVKLPDEVEEGNDDAASSGLGVNDGRSGEEVMMLEVIFEVGDVKEVVDDDEVDEKVEEVEEDVELDLV